MLNKKIDFLYITGVTSAGIQISNVVETSAQSKNKTSSKVKLGNASTT